MKRDAKQNRGWRQMAAGCGVLLAMGWAAPGALAEPLSSTTVSVSASDRALEDLLVVPAFGLGRGPLTTDEALAAAVRVGNEPGLEKKNPFRKRSFDLFRTEHDVEIWRQAMRVRFRLRPKTKEMMSVELKY